MVLNSLGLIIIGVKYPILLGIISAFFNFIPYFGTLMGGAVPLLFVLLTTTDPMYYTLKVIILFAIIQFTENNILTPNIVGSNVNINPFFIITGLVFGGMVWGIPGMLLIVPFLAIARIIFSHLDQWKPLSFLLGPKGTTQHSISIQNIREQFRKKKNNKSTNKNHTEN
jgi:predicted PurR-regulated permease PerM